MMELAFMLGINARNFANSWVTVKTVNLLLLSIGKVLLFLRLVNNVKSPLPVTICNIYNWTGPFTVTFLLLLRSHAANSHTCLSSKVAAIQNKTLLQLTVMSYFNRRTPCRPRCTYENAVIVCTRNFWFVFNVKTLMQNGKTIERSTLILPKYKIETVCVKFIYRREIFFKIF